MEKIKLKHEEFKSLIENTVRRVIKEYSSDYDSQSNGDYALEQKIGSIYQNYSNIVESLIELNNIGLPEYEKKLLSTCYPQFLKYAREYYGLLGFNVEDLNLPEQL